MKFLVMGASGMAGHQIAIYLKEQGHDVVGFVRKKVDFVDSIEGDATDLEFVREVVRLGNYDAVINAVGILNQDAEIHKERAVLLNAYLPHYLAEITKDLSTQIVHMSTDCVFSGKKGNYTENSLRDGETFYDRSKALGELEDNKNITFRNSIIGPDINQNGIGLLNWFMKQNGTINGYTGAMWTGLTTLQLAKVIERAVQQKATGLYNMVPNRNISKYDLLNLFNRYLRNQALNIEKYDAFRCDKTLIRTRFEFAEVMPDYETMIQEMAEWMRNHKALYPHYGL
ncbi:MAG: SDR family oxidoreductase [Aerococcaceae bacterium]|nr:SDR family oxidoreductase [Aerococcaceae bacterium]